MLINYSKQAIKFLNKQDKPTRVRIVDAINQLPKGDVKKLQGEDGYRLRIGDYRVIFVYCILTRLTAVDRFTSRRFLYERSKRKNTWCSYSYE